jgi:hypothetical protein
MSGSPGVIEGRRGKRLREDLGIAGRRQFGIPGLEIVGPGPSVRKNAGQEICVATGRGVVTSAPQGVVQQQGKDVHAATGGGPPGHRVSPGMRPSWVLRN